MPERLSLSPVALERRLRALSTDPRPTARLRRAQLEVESLDDSLQVDGLLRTLTRPVHREPPDLTPLAEAARRLPALRINAHEKIEAKQATKALMSQKLAEAHRRMYPTPEERRAMVVRMMVRGAA